MNKTSNHVKHSTTLFWLVSALLLPSILLAVAAIVSVVTQGTGNSLGNLTVFWTLFNGPVTIAVGLLIRRRVPGNAVGPLLALWGVQNTLWSVQGLTLRAVASIFTQSLGLTAGIYLFVYFPNGKPFPVRAARLYLIGFIALALNGLLFVLAHPTFTTVAVTITQQHPLYVPALAWLQPITEMVYYAALSLWLWGPLTLVLRYRDTSLREQIQIKWMALVAILMVPTAASILIANSILGRPAPAWFNFYLAVTYTFFQLSPAIFIGISILRYRLWDIDIIIRRTLIYGVLTALLALFYFGSVVVLQQLFRALTGAGGELAIIISTLVIAALSNPLRHRVQDAIDRRFYRRKYDAQKVLAQFAATARDEVDLNALTSELAGVVRETMQPASVSVWLKSRDSQVRR
ncbi:MAG: hypothetical protein HY782_19760 [Chloroflexi bacterium]|nr:hypothetical protein [Chloroflexota bacterium]